MSILSSYYFHFTLTLDKKEKEQFKDYLNNQVNQIAGYIYNQKVDVHIELKDGSLKTWVAVIGSIYIAIGQYGSFRSGLTQIIDDSKMVKNIVTNKMIKAGIAQDVILETKNMDATPQKIRRLLLRINKLEEKVNILNDEELQREKYLIRHQIMKMLFEIENKDDVNEFINEIMKSEVIKNDSLHFDIHKPDIFVRKEIDDEIWKRKYIE